MKKTSLGFASRAVQALAGALLIQSCSLGPPVEPPPLPFHAAVIPVARSTNATTVEDESGGMEFQLDQAELSATLAESLEGQTFAQVTLLTPPEDGSVRTMSDPQWLAEARAIGADLVIACELAQPSRVQHETNALAWLNYLLFLLGGPATYLIDDRTYQTDANLRIHVYGLDPGATTRLSRRYELLRFDSTREEVRLDFIDRADHVGHWLLSLVIPGAWFAQETGAAASRLQSQLTRALSESVCERLRESQGELVRPTWVDFFLPPDEEFVAELRGDRMHVRGDVLLQKGRVDHLDQYWIFAGDRVFEGEFKSRDGERDDQRSASGADVVRYVVDAWFDAPVDTDSVRLVVQDPTTSGATRTWTLPVRAIAGGRSPTVLAAH